MNLARRHSTWARVDLNAIETNVSYFLESTGREVLAVVKANAYGHGAVPVSNAAIRAGATWLAVARVDEALELREAGIDARILILGPTPPERVDAMTSADVSLTVWDAAQIDAVGDAAARMNKPARLHLKVDTGMSRLGVQVSSAGELAYAIFHHPALEFEGIFTHFARADEVDAEPTRAQLDGFRELVDALASQGLRPPLVHSANSAAGLAYPDAWFDLIRVGIAMYGLQPSSSRRLPGTFRPALSWMSSLAMVKTLPPGKGVSYGHVYTTAREERIGTVPVGYADGYRRVQSNEVLVRGRRVPVVGRVTMDQIMLQLDAIPEAQVGDEVVLLGIQKQASITAEEIADVWGTINYEVVGGISKRVPRIY
jgi:alanine racemase